MTTNAFEEKVALTGLKIIGISIETTNENNQSAEDIGQLWGRFFAENIAEKISNKLSTDIYSVYTNYQSNYTGKYTTILGLKVSSIGDIPEGLVGMEFKAESFTLFVAKGEMPQAVVTTWQKIWSLDGELKRKYTYDFEVYSEKSWNGKDSEVEIYIATS